MSAREIDLEADEARQRRRFEAFFQDGRYELKMYRRMGVAMSGCSDEDYCQGHAILLFEKEYRFPPPWLDKA